ncbi:MAG TPA: hypothetical protein VNH44_15865 [Micropepsaceae bacterium]|nr:hypothetical protein [Micropepsaceae bacterium]
MRMLFADMRGSLAAPQIIAVFEIFRVFVIVGPLRGKATPLVLAKLILRQPGFAGPFGGYVAVLGFSVSIAF